MARVVVTGARRGIGREIALLLARAGYTVITTMRRTDDCDLAEIAGRDNLAIIVASMDVDDDASVADFFAAAVGSEPIDVLINNAGIGTVNLLRLGAWKDAMLELGAIMRPLRRRSPQPSA
jgi:NAD(P)-dependent dehydrogenase (short-subunit alcohol dehydrogenase family)